MELRSETMTLDINENDIKIILKILKKSNPSVEEQEAVFNLVQFLEHILNSP